MLDLHITVVIRHVKVHVLNSAKHIDVMERTALFLIVQQGVLVSHLKTYVLVTHVQFKTVRDQTVSILLFPLVHQYRSFQTAQLIHLHVPQTVQQNVIKQHV